MYHIGSSEGKGCLWVKIACLLRASFFETWLMLVVLEKLHSWRLLKKVSAHWISYLWVKKCKGLQVSASRFKNFSWHFNVEADNKQNLTFLSELWQNLNSGGEEQTICQGSTHFAVPLKLPQWNPVSSLLEKWRFIDQCAKKYWNCAWKRQNPTTQHSPREIKHIPNCFRVGSPLHVYKSCIVYTDVQERVHNGLNCWTKLGDFL